MQIVVLAVLALVAGGVAVAIWYGERTMRTAEVHPAVEGADHRDRVTLGGVDGPGTSHAHGRGVLALHPDHLIFVSASVPHHVIDIPTSQITTVDLTTALRLRHHWRRNRRHWLRVRWQTGTGVATLGVVVPDPALWARALKHVGSSDTNG
jgi:hypothetical protein